MKRLYHHIFCSLLIPTMLVCGTAVSSHGQNKSESNSQKTKSTAVRKKVVSEITPALEKEALEFAQEHHPELASLLKLLKTMDNAAYRSAITELSRSAERINRLKDKPGERYSFDLRRWKLDSKIRLLAARSTMNGDLSQNSELLELLKQRQQLQLEQLQAERKRLLERLTRIDDSIEQKTKKSDELLAADLKRLQSTLSSKVNRKKAGKPAAKTSKNNLNRPGKRPAS